MHIIHQSPLHPVLTTPTRRLRRASHFEILLLLLLLLLPHTSTIPRTDGSSLARKKAIYVSPQNASATLPTSPPFPPVLRLLILFVDCHGGARHRATITTGHHLSTLSRFPAASPFTYHAGMPGRVENHPLKKMNKVRGLDRQRTHDPHTHTPSQPTRKRDMNLAKGLLTWPVRYTTPRPATTPPLPYTPRNVDVHASAN
ncbi:unnamed protein product [Ectocarpus sp. 4 AP-2014]